MDYDRQLISLMLTFPQTVPQVREHLHVEDLKDAGVRALVKRVIALAESSAQVGPAELLARTQEEELRAIVEEMIAREPATVNTADPDGTCSWLLRQIEARSQMRLAGELHRKVTTMSAPSATDLNARLHALQEAHRARGTLLVKRTSNGGTG
jgi:hypothetical protein